MDRLLRTGYPHSGPLLREFSKTYVVFGAERDNTINKYN